MSIFFNCVLKLSKLSIAIVNSDTPDVSWMSFHLSGDRFFKENINAPVSGGISLIVSSTLVSSPFLVFFIYFLVSVTLISPSAFLYNVSSKSSIKLVRPWFNTPANSGYFLL